MKYTGTFAMYKCASYFVLCRLMGHDWLNGLPAEPAKKRKRRGIEMFEVTYETINQAQLEAYLERIQWQGKADATKETLDQFVYLHQCNVPFENLDIYPVYKGIRLDGESLYEKIVVQRRGGFCFELNGAFMLLLRAAGFDAYPCVCRVASGRTTLRPLTHRATIVRLDGREYLCDVGLGGAMAPFAVELSTERQTVHGETFWVENLGEDWNVEFRMNSENQPETVIVFNRQPFLQTDFEPFCQALLNIPECIFRQKRMVNLRLSDGHVSIENQTLIVKKDSGETRKEFREDELPGILREWFRFR